MSTMNPFEKSSAVADAVAQSADHAIRSTQRMTNDALDTLAGSVRDVRHEVTPVLNRATEQVTGFAQHGLDVVRDGSRRIRAEAQHASEATVNYIRHEPVKAVLIAAATGAVLMALVSLIARSRHHG